MHGKISEIIENTKNEVQIMIVSQFFLYTRKLIEEVGLESCTSNEKAKN